MIPLVTLKKDVQFNGDLTAAIDALKGIALAKYFALEKKLKLFNEFAKVIDGFFPLVDISKVKHPFIQAANHKTLVLMVTSDEGFLGGLNAQVLSHGIAEAGKDGLLWVIGEKGASALRDQRIPCEGFHGIKDGATYALSVELKQKILKTIMNGVCGKFSVVFPNPISLAVQKVTVEKIIPCSEWAPKNYDPKLADSFLWESSSADVASYLVSQKIGHRLNQIFELSRLAELAARAMHLEGSYQELQRLGKKLKMQYFRARHEIIDRSIREVFSAQLLFRGKAELAELEPHQSVDLN